MPAGTSPSWTAARSPSTTPTPFDRRQRPWCRAGLPLQGSGAVADTMVIVNCGGRTRSIIGAQSLINAGVPNKVVSLKDGTMAWHLRASRSSRAPTGGRPRSPSIGGAPIGRALANAAEFRASILPRSQPGVPRATGARSIARRAHTRGIRGRSCGGVGPRPAGSWCRRPTTISPPGAPASCSPTRGVRAMTASWLKQMGWADVAVMRLDDAPPGTRVTGPHPSSRPRPRSVRRVAAISPVELSGSARSGHSYAHRSRVFETLLPKRPHPWGLVCNAHAAWRSP